MTRPDRSRPLTDPVLALVPGRHGTDRLDPEPPYFQGEIYEHGGSSCLADKPVF
jgi:hypothetical protein